jgi:transcriptional regulator with XRE-family HTH domain
MNFKSNLKYLREKEGYSRVEIAKKLNMTSAAYGAYELGNREPKLEKLCEIARLFHTSPNDLLGRLYSRAPRRFEERYRHVPSIRLHRPGRRERL